MKQLLAGQERHIPSGTGRYHTPSHEHYTKKLSVRLGAYLNARLRKDLAEKHRIADEIIEELNTEGFTMIAKNGTELTTLKQKRAKIFVKFRGMVRSRQNQERRSPFHRQNCG
uniref:Uncharacterized protein n=2 Tax=Craspedostauros australis TaxID=1486917 RepID=A0A7R9WMB3_9STRA